jgi:ribosomal protein S1
VRVNCDNKGAPLNLEGLVHISEVSWEKVSELSSLYKNKDKIKIKLISKDEGRLQFSIKRLSDDPWEKIENKYPKDKETEGEVVRLANFGALVKLETGVEGLIHISKLTGGVSLKEGDKVQVYIESIDVQKRKISLGIVETNKKNVIYK